MDCDGREAESAPLIGALGRELGIDQSINQVVEHDVALIFGKGIHSSDFSDDALDRLWTSDMQLI